MTSLIISVLLIGIGLYIWIRRGMKSFQRKQAWERNEELFLQEKDALARELARYKDMHETVMAANHRVNHRLAALERRVAHMYARGRAEFGEELAITLSDIRQLSGEYRAQVDAVGADRALPATHIQTLDDLFALFAERFACADIDFHLKVNGSIHAMCATAIDKGKLETLIGDHLQDALAAVRGGGTPRRVLAMLGEAGSCYEFSVHDSGVAFAVDTLTRLGTARVTTHAGGSGIGFVTTFATLRERGASLLIRENAPGSVFTKSVTFRFDGKNRYIIETHRANAFPASDRYTVIKLPSQVAEEGV